jgi:hypothetical protein
LCAWASSSARTRAASSGAAASNSDQLGIRRIVDPPGPGTIIRDDGQTLAIVLARSALAVALASAGYSAFRSQAPRAVRSAQAQQ